MANPLRIVMQIEPEEQSLAGFDKSNTESSAAAAINDGECWFKRDNNDAGDETTTCEAVTWRSMRFVPIESVSVEQIVLVLHRHISGVAVRDLRILARWADGVINRWS
jgi:hypothetical protein